MLAALLATRTVTPPAPILNYGNQWMAATTTFDIVTVTRRAAFLTTSPSIKIQLSLSLPGQESVLDLLNRKYFSIISQFAADNPVFLSNTIIQVISTATALVSTLATLPVATSDASRLAGLQQKLGIALYRLRSLGRRQYPPGWPDERKASG